MVTAQLMGGLGNMMFQIAAAYSVARENNDVALFDFDKHYLPLQGQSVRKYENNIFRNVKNSKIERISTVHQEENFRYSNIPYQKDMALYGYYQSEKYFLKYKEKILSLFESSEDTKNYINEKYGNILKTPDLTSIHVRRGDYIKFSQIHPLCTPEYYSQASRIVSPSASFMIFSDDIEWCKNNLDIQNTFFVEEEKDYIDLYLMSMCKNNIIANSSFSWWSAWLNTNPAKIIIAPKIWFGPGAPHDIADLLPGWKKI